MRSATLTASPRSSREQDEHGLERAEVGERRDLDLRVEVGVGPADARDAPDQDAARVDRREALRAPARRDDRVADPDDGLLRDAVEAQRRARPVRRCRTTPGGAARDVERRDGALVVGQERHPRSAGAHPADLADEAVLR